MVQNLSAGGAKDLVHSCCAAFCEVVAQVLIEDFMQGRCDLILDLFFVGDAVCHLLIEVNVNKIGVIQQLF